MAASVLSLGLAAGWGFAQQVPAGPSASYGAQSTTSTLPAPTSVGQAPIIIDSTQMPDSPSLLDKLKGVFHRNQTAADGSVVVTETPPNGVAAPAGMQLPAITSSMPAMAAPPPSTPPAEVPTGPVIKHVGLAISSDGAAGTMPDSTPAVVAPEKAPPMPEPLPPVAADFTTALAQQPIPGTRPQTSGGQQQSPGYMESDTTETSPEVSVIPPGPETVFRRESEMAVLERIRQKALERVPPERVDFPDEPILPNTQTVFRPFPAEQLLVEPNYVQYRRLLFEDINTERYGWDMGIIQPVVSTAKFLGDFITMPYHLGTQPTRLYEASAGYCLPGDPVPYIVYPPILSVTGAIYEAGAVLAVYAIFPG